MDDITKEELAAEQEALQEGKEEEIRAKVIEDFGFDEVDDAERIEKLVAKEMDSRKALSAAIGQKIKYREDAKKAKETPVIEPKKTPAVSDEDFEKKLDEKLNARLEQRDLESLSYPDELKGEIKKLSQILGVSVKEAAKDPYIVSKIEAYEKEKEADDGAVSRNHKSGGTKKPDLDNPPDIDPNDPKSIERYDKWKEEMKKQGF